MLADGGGHQSSLVVARWPVRRPWRQLTMVTWLWVLVSGGADCAWVLLVSYGGFWKYFLFYVAASSRCSHLANWTLRLHPRFFQLCSGEWVLPMEYSVWIFGTRALLGSTVDTRSSRGFGRISTFSTLP